MKKDSAVLNKPRENQGRRGTPAMELSREIDIAAPPERVWAVLTDFATYGDWHPYQTIEGELKNFGKVYVTSRKFGSDQVSERSRAVILVEGGKKLEFFSGNVLVWSSFRWFHLSPSAKGTVLRHGVKMSGFFARRAFKRTHRIEGLQPLYAAVSEAVARRAISPNYRCPLRGEGNRHARRASKAKQGK